MGVKQVHSIIASRCFTHEEFREIVSAFSPYVKQSKITWISWRKSQVEKYSLDNRKTNKSISGI